MTAAAHSPEAANGRARFTFDVSGGQIDGARDYQEDAFLITHLGEPGNGALLVIVADGMGGHAAGNVASNLAVQAFNKHVTANFPSDDIPTLLREAVDRANEAIAETVRETAALRGMGCTLVAAVLEGDLLYWASVGDSHLYLLRNDTLIKKNADHSYGGFLDRMAAEGHPTDAEPGLSRNMLMSALTGEDIAEVDCPRKPLRLEDGDRLILCTDGLDTLTHGQTVYVCDSAGEPRACVDALLKAVEAADVPRQDNTTVVVVDVHAQARQPAHPPAAAPAGVQGDGAPPAATADATASRPDAQTSPDASARQEEPGGARRLWAVALAALALAAAGGGWYWWQQRTDRAGPPYPPLATVTTPDAAGPPPAAAPPAPEPEPEPEPGPQPAAEDPGTGPVTAAAPQPATGTARPAASATTRLESFRDRLASGGEGPEMVLLPGGRYLMGSRRLSADPDEKPAHEVSVPPFAISRHEVTMALYRRFARATGRPAPDTLGLDPRTHPAVFVSWDDALAFTRWLSRESGRRYRLPSEAEWEYAARAGTTTPYWWGQRMEPGRAHCIGCDSPFDPRRPTRVGSFAPNPFGLYDTAGNVAEWVHDCYHPSYRDAPADGSVWEGGDCSVRVARGGSYANAPKALRSANRETYRANRGYDEVGLRVVREP